MGHTAYTGHTGCVNTPSHATQVQHISIAICNVSKDLDYLKFETWRLSQKLLTLHAVEDEIAAEDLETNKYVCGVKGTYRAGRVVGGEDAVPGEWCWQVGLHILHLHFGFPPSFIAK